MVVADDPVAVDSNTVVAVALTDETPPVNFFVAAVIS